MKKLLLVLLVLPLLLCSCSSDDNDGYTNADLVGVWLFESQVAADVEANKDIAVEALKKDIL